MAPVEKLFANAVPAAVSKQFRVPTRHTSVGRVVAPALVILVAGALLGLPLLLHGLLPRGHDVPQHLRRYAAFRQSFSIVNLYPRWLSKGNGGLGDPIFFVYGPLPYMVAAALRPLAPSSLGGHSAFPEFVLAAWIALAASGFTCFLWLQTFVPWKPALAAAVLYLAVPFHLWGNLYIRGDIPECWALLWMPLTLFFVHGVAARRRHAEIGLAISYALLVGSHLFTVVLFSPVLLLDAAVMGEKGQHVRNVMRTTAGMTLGAGVSAAYLFTALAHEPNISAFRFLSEGGYVFARDFLQFSRNVLLDKGLLHGGGHFAGRLTWVTLDTIAVAACAVFVAWRASERRQVRLWTSVCALSLFLMSPVSIGVWRVMPGLELLQFPWRLNDVVCVAVAALLAMALAQFPRRFRVSNCLAVAVGVVLLVVWGESYVHVWRQYDLQRYEMAKRDDLALADDTLRFVWLRWTPPELYTPQALAELGRRPPAEFVDSRGTAAVASFADRHIEITTTSATGGPLLVRQFFYPGWTARDEAGELSVRPSQPEGLISITVPSGAHHVLASWLISALSLLVCAFGLRSGARASNSEMKNGRP
jgi:hypothetical protein